jgi:adenine-specific DNA-methyltransferase
MTDLLDSMYDLSSTVTSSIADGSRAVVMERDTLDGCNTLSSELFSLIISSPPYNIGKAYESQVSLEQYLAWQESVIVQLVRLLAPDGSLCWQVGNFVDNGEIIPLDVLFYPIFKKHGLKLRNRIVWHFDHGLHASKRFSGRYETLLWFTKSDEYVFNLDDVRIPSKYPGKRHFKGANVGKPSGNPLGKNPSDYWIEKRLREDWESLVWEIPNVKSNHVEKTEHPCQFPVELVERCVLAMTNENDWVLDPFGGVGSSVVGAIRHNRRGVSIDSSHRYCEIAIERFRDYYSGNLKTRPLGKPVHVPSGKLARAPSEWSQDAQPPLQI